MSFIPFASRGVEERSIDCVLYQSIYCWHKGRHICLLLFAQVVSIVESILFSFQIALLLVQGLIYLSSTVSQVVSSVESVLFSFQIALLLAQALTYLSSTVAQVVSIVESILFSFQIALLLAPGLTYLSSTVSQVVSSVPSIVFFTNRSAAGTRVDIFVF